MIKLFRNIRKNLINEGKTSKYFKYAIGEIILVVIGILIALQINNWNENRKISVQEAIYLQDLKSDITFDIETLHDRISQNTFKINSIDTIFKLITSSKQFTEQDETIYVNLIASLFGESYFIPEKGTINQIQASSSGSFIKNKTLSDLIFRYYSDSERKEKNMEQSLQIYQHQIITPALLHPVIAENNLNISAKLPPLDLSLLITNNDYINALSLKYVGTQNQNKTYKDTIKKAEAILALINSEIENE